MADDVIPLTDDQRQQLARELAKPELDHTQRMERPRAILTGGQPGSGKSSIVNSISVQFEGVGGVMIVDPDGIRPQLPYMRERIAKGELDIPNAANVDAGTVAYQMVQIAKAEKRNVLIDGTLQNTDRAVLLAEELKEAGFDVEMHGMAVYPDLSHARTYSRREAEIASSPTGFGRGVGDEFHDQAVKGFTKTVSAYQTRRVVGSINFYNDRGALETECKLVNGTWVPAIDMSRELRRLHTQPSEQTRATAFDTWGRARDAMERRQAPPEETQKVAQFREAALATLTPAQIAERYKAAVEREFNAIRERAQKVAAELDRRAAKLHQVSDTHDRARPEAPRGLSAMVPGAKASYEAHSGDWSRRSIEIRQAIERTETRADYVRSFAQRGADGFPSRGETLAAQKVAQRDPALARAGVAAIEQMRREHVLAQREELTQQRSQRAGRTRLL